MKAIVAEIDKKQMIVITDKGDFFKIKRQMSAAIGDEIEFNARKSYMKYKRLAPIAACFLACIFLSTGVYAYYTPYSYVSVDINPSIAMSLNRFERVISVDPLTKDSVEFIKNTANLKNQEIDKALSEIIKSASKKGYIDEKSENQVMVVVSSKDPKQEEKLAGTVNKAAANELSKLNDSSEVTVEKTSVESYKAAVSNKVSPGREILADKLREVNPEIKDEEVQNMTVKEAVKLIKEGRKADKAAEKDNKQAERDEEREEQLQSKKSRHEKDENEAEKAEPEDKKDNNGHGKTKPSAAEKDSELKATEESKGNKGGNESKDQETASEPGKNAKGNKEADEDKSSVKDKDKNKDKDKENKGKDKENIDEGNGGSLKEKWNLKGKVKSQDPEDLKQIIEEMMKMKTINK